jgi:spermidine synthase/MFS family permease
VTTPLKRKLLPIAVFLTGASVLILEVVAVRVLSPYYGNTIFTVSSVISVILLALSFGYYAGGKLADRHPTLPWFFAIIQVSGVVLLLFYFLGTITLPILSSVLSISVGPLASAALLFLLPAMLLGTLSPYAVKLQSIYFPEQGVGSVAGNIFFWSTLGSITGSLLAGFVLIPNFGVDRILIANGISLFALGFVCLLGLGSNRKNLYRSLVVFIPVIGATIFAAHRANGTSLYSKDGIYERITIHDGAYGGRPTRFFQQDRSSSGASSGAMFLDSNDPTDLVYDYTKYYSLYKIFTPRVEHALVIGGGAYSVPKALLRELPDAEIDVAEIEPSLYGLAKKYFDLPESPRLHDHVEDGRRLLQDSSQRYDLIFSDVYYSFFAVPPHFTTKEFFSVAKSRLSAGGVIVVNMIGDLSRQQPSLILAEIKTFQTVFPNSYFFAVDSPEKTYSQNIMLVGSNSDSKVDMKSPSITGHKDSFIRFLGYKAIDVDHRFDLSPYPILTDNFAPVEYLTAQVLRRAFAKPRAVDGSEMLAVVDQELRYGPPSAGSPAQNKMRDFLSAEMGVLAEDTKTQTWSHTDPSGQTKEFTNVIGRFYATQERRVVLATRYDGESGATSASGVAILIGLMSSLGNSPVAPNVGLDIVFLDDAQEGPKGPRGGMPGSTYFADHLSELYNNTKPVSAIVLNDVCDTGLKINKEPASIKSAATQVEALWNIGREIDSRVFQNQTGSGSPGDDVPLSSAGIPTVLVAGSEPSSGQIRNTCSAQSMETVARVLMKYVLQIAPSSSLP